MKHLAFALLVSVVCLTSVRAQSADEKKATIDYLRGLQTENGGFLPNRLPGESKMTPTLRATSSGLRALKYFGGEPRDAKACVKYVEVAFDKESGGFIDNRLDPKAAKPDVFSTAVGLMAVVELKMPREPVVEPALKFLAANAKDFEQIRIAAAGCETVGQQPKAADAWIEQIVKVRNPDGTYGSGANLARDTGGSVVAFLRLGGKLENRDHVLKTLKAGQQADGGYGKEGQKGSDLETSYRVLRAFHMLKEKPDAGKLRDFVAKCRNADGGYGVQPGTASSIGGTYFASIILHWLEDK